MRHLQLMLYSLRENRAAASQRATPQKHIWYKKHQTETAVVICLYLCNEAKINWCGDKDKENKKVTVMVRLPRGSGETWLVASAVFSPYPTEPWKLTGKRRFPIWEYHPLLISLAEQKITHCVGTEVLCPNPIQLCLCWCSTIHGAILP